MFCRLSRSATLRTLSVLSLAALFALAASHSRAAEGTKSIEWVGDLGTAKEMADATGKPLLIVFGADWCGYCKKLDRETLAHPQVSRYINDGFIPVHMDLDKQKWAARILEVKTLPCTVVLAPNADQLGRIVGYEDPSPFFKKLTQARRMQDRITQTSGTQTSRK